MSKMTNPAAGVVQNADLKSLVFGQIQKGAASAASANNMPNLLPVDQASIGQLPWFWQNGTNFNALTYNWLNNIFEYSDDGYMKTNSQALTTGYNNVLLDTRYVLDAADSAALNEANLANAAVVDTLITNWATSQGPFPSGTTSQSQELLYILTQVLAWGVAGLTLGQLRTSANPMALLPNIPLGGDQVVSNLMTYLANTSSVANIQAAVSSFNAQLLATEKNVAPQPAPTTVTAGFMETVDDKGNTLIVPSINIVEPVGVIHSNLIPTSGGTKFNASYTATNQSSGQVQLTAESESWSGLGLGFLTFADAHTSTNFGMFDFQSSLTSCTINLTFNGVTTFTPQFSPYNVSTGFGWWNPEPIEEAANPVPNQSGYVFTPTPSYNFGVKENFGVIAALLISQQPVISLTYSTSDFASFQQFFHQHTSWDVSFCGIGLGSGSSDYYSSQTSQDSTAGTVTLTMSPAGISTPIAATDQFAYVVGAEILWPGASTLQNRAGI
jgi:hypothetical protein